ncbi:hypothetical protein [Niabella aurantiaca]|uniref:hypothetical protein n=1 Tax=Niabella aurantiaca TaxID=379900 RepID=UPI000366EE23|nr:hypothetical protein [Niabella aurantiaca]
MTTLIQHNNKNYKVDLENRRITFLDTRFYYSESGQFLPSVTTILEAYPKGAQYYEWLKKNGQDSDDIRDEAGRRGSIVHNLTERYDAGEELSLLDNNGNLGYTLTEWNALAKWVNFRERHKFDVIYSEQNIVSDKLGHAGTLDRIISIDGELWLLDIKTSSAIYPSYWLQVAAYKQMAETELNLKIDRVGIWWSNAKTRTEKEYQGVGWQLVTKTDTTKDTELFNATKKLWLAENEGSKPKQVSYSLSYLLDTMPAQLVCKKCGVADDIVIGEGKGPHFAAITCGSCGGYIKWATEKEVNSLTIKNK